VPRRVVGGAGIGARGAGAALVEEDYAVDGGVEELGVGFGDVATRAAVEVDGLGNVGKRSCVV
jgi:hypothetical protein